ncbi:hypothetical protein ACIHAR_07720 [Streptomyces sp. NPDC052016]
MGNRRQGTTSRSARALRITPSGALTRRHTTGQETEEDAYCITC